MADTNLNILINAKDNASSVLHGVSKTSQSVFGSLTKAAVGFGLAGGAALTGFTALSVKSANESEAQLAQLGAVLKSTGGVAGVTSQAAIDLSKALQKTTTFSDEAVLSVENLLLTFTGISKDKFPEATKAVLDMSVALGQDTKSSAIQLGKALQDPILGVTALRRVGVNFSDAQREVIKKLVETGKKSEAQKLILKELATEFGGSATAKTKTFGGALEQLRNSIDDLQEQFGTVIIQAITPFVKALAEWATSTAGQEFIQGLITAFQKFMEVTGQIIKTVLPLLIQAFNFLKPALQGFLDSLVPMWQAFQRLWLAIQPLLPIIGVLLVAALYGVIVAFTLANQAVTFLINKFLDFVGFLATFGTAVAEKINYVRDNFGKVLTEDIPKFLGTLTGLFLAFIAKAIIFFVTLPFNLSKALWDNKGTILDIAGKVMDGIKAVFKAGVDAVIDFFVKLPQRAWDAVKAGFKAIKNFAGAAGDSFKKAMGFAQGGFVPGPFGAPQLAVVHGGEKILSPTMQDVNNNLGGITINMNGNFNLDSPDRVDELARRITQILGRQTELSKIGVF